MKKTVSILTLILTLISISSSAFEEFNSEEFSSSKQHSSNIEVSLFDSQDCPDKSHGHETPDPCSSNHCHSHGHCHCYLSSFSELAPYNASKAKLALKNVLNLSNPYLSNLFRPPIS